MGFKPKVSAIRQSTPSEATVDVPMRWSLHSLSVSLIDALIITWSFDKLNEGMPDEDWRCSLFGESSTAIACPEA